MVGSRWLGVAALLVACAGKSESSGSTANGGGALTTCDPLASVTTSSTLDAAQVVAAGRASDGTLYVIYGDDRLFVGNGDALAEQVVTGSGQDGTTQLELLYNDSDGAQVTVELTRGDAGDQMAVARGAQKGKGIDPGQGEVLTPVDASTVVKLGSTTTSDFQVDFAGSLDDGRELVVVAPTHAGSYDDYRVFFGKAGALAQRVVTNFGSSLSGQRYATVSIDGAAADLTYLAGGPSKINPNGGPSTLTIAGTSFDLTEGPLPTDASYLCLSD